MRRTIFASLILLAFTASAGSFSYILSHDGNKVISGNLDVDRLVRINERLHAPYLWARVNGREYVIRDKATLALATAAFRYTDAAHAEHERLEARMRPIKQREDEIEDEMDDLSDDLSDREDLSRTERDRMERRIQELERLLKPVRQQLRALEAEEEKIDQREEKLEAQAEKELREIIDSAIRRGLAQRP